MADPYEEFQKPKNASSVDPYAEFQISPPAGYAPSKQNLTTEDAESVGRGFLDLLPGAAAAAATMAVPEVAMPAWIAAGLGGAGGSVVKQGIEKATGEGGPSSIPEAINRAGTEGAIQSGAELGTRALTGALAKTFGAFADARRLYQSGLKPTGTPAQAARNVMTGLREGIPLSEQAPAVAGQRIDALNSKIEGIIANSPADIPPSQYVSNIENRFDALRSQWAKDATSGTQNVAQIDAAERAFLLNHGNAQPIQKVVMKPGNVLGANGQPVMVPTTVTVAPEQMTLQELRAQARPLDTGDAQAIKKQTYKTIRRANSMAWEQGSNPALATDINQEITGALKEELQGIYPELGKLNPREGALIELEKALQGYNKREFNKQVTPYFIFPAAGGLLGMGHGYEGSGAGMLAGHYLRSALEDPAVKSRLAIALFKAGNIPGAKAVAGVVKNAPGVAIHLGADALNPPPMPPK